MSQKQPSKPLTYRQWIRKMETKSNKQALVGLLLLLVPFVQELLKYFGLDSIVPFVPQGLEWAANAIVYLLGLGGVMMVAKAEPLGKKKVG